MRRLAGVLALAAATLLAACSGAEPAPSPRPSTPAASSTAGTQPPASSLAWTPCAEGFSCADLTVPVQAGAPGTVALAVTRRPASGPRLGVLVVNPGGPGASAVGSLQASWRSLPAALAQSFDLVAFDPRGVGLSDPVRCGTTTELDRYWALDPSPDTPAELTAYVDGTSDLVRTCSTAPGPAELLGHLSTADAAEDLDRLRVALGEERLSYLGYSYGTAIGAAYLDRHAAQVRTMVLDGALDPALSWDALVEGQARGFDGALAAMLADCERTRCAFRRATTGDLGAAFDALAARVDATPLPTSSARTAGPGAFTLAVGQGLYDRQSGWPALAAALATAQRGDGRGLLALADAYLDRTGEGYGPLLSSYLAVTCVDQPWPRDASAYTALAARLAQVAPRFGPAVAYEALPCATWPVPPVSTPHRVRADGAPPVVVVGTTRDPATPYAWAVSLAAQLASGVLVTHEGDGHTVYRRGGPACLVDPVTDYLVGGTQPRPLRC